MTGPLLVALVLSALPILPSQASAQGPTCLGLQVTIDLSQNGGNGNGTPGRDVILGTPGRDTINGFRGNDTICGGGGDDLIFAGQGDDRVAGDAGADTIHGDAGTDWIVGGDGPDVLHGGPGTDWVVGGDGPDMMHGEGEDDTMRGGAGDDTMFGGDGSDTIFGFEGADVLDGGNGDDWLYGNLGNDTILGGAGNDRMFGYLNDDTLEGGPGNDRVYGNSGRDMLRGDDGNDILDGGIHYDVCEGNEGDDKNTDCEFDPSAPVAPVSALAQFEETFDNNTGLERFRTGVYHRDSSLVTQPTWTGDHDLSCGPPSTTRTIHRDVPDEFIYLCRDHLMTSIGDTAGYSVGWFSPDQVFTSVTEVCWEINLTNLGNRQWWKVAVVSANGPDVMSEVGASALSGIEGPDRAVASWGGVGGWLGKLRIGNARMDGFELDGGSDKMTRYPACFRDNQDGTLTFAMTGPTGDGVTTESFVTAGSFPSGPVKIVFQDHNYTPTKDDNGVGTPIGFTWHWDNIFVG